MASTITTTYFLSLFDEFKRVSPVKIQAYLDIATTRVPPTVWGAAANYATALLTAHMLTASGPQGQGSGGGAVSDESVGDVSRSFAQVFQAGAGDAPLMTTRYGIDFVALRRENIPTAMTASRPRGGRCW